MKTLLFQRIEGEALQRIRIVLADRAVRVALHGEDRRVAEAQAIASWCDGSAEAAGVRRLAVRCVALDEIVGGISFAGRVLSYFVARPFWGLGYGGALVRQFFRDDDVRFSDVEAHAVRENIASRRILESAGFREAGLVRRDRGLPCVVAYVRRSDTHAAADAISATARHPSNGA